MPRGRSTRAPNTRRATVARRFRGKGQQMYRRRNSRPRNRIQLNPLARPNVYPFMRSHTYNVSIGVADAGNDVLMNTDNKAMIVKLRTKFSKLPDYGDFQALFNQYKITSICTQMIPFYKDNVPFTKGDQTLSADYGVAIPNFQVYYIPENYSIDLPDLSTKNITQIDDYMNQAQKKAYRLFPSKQKTLWNKRPSVPDAIYDAKAGAVAPAAMIRAPWMDGDAVNNEIYGLQLVIMRVDREALNSHNNSSNIFQHMGWRVRNDVYFETRKVQ